MTVTLKWVCRDGGGGRLFCQKGSPWRRWTGQWWLGRGTLCRLTCKLCRRWRAGQHRRNLLLHEGENPFLLWLLFSKGRRWWLAMEVGGVYIGRRKGGWELELRRQEWFFPNVRGDCVILRGILWKVVDDDCICIHGHWFILLFWRRAIDIEAGGGCGKVLPRLW